MSSNPPHLINCTGRSIRVSINGKLVELPEEPAPTISDRSRSTRKLTLSHPEHEGSFELEIGEGRADLMMMLPEPRENTYFLVEAATLLRLPERDDLLTPAMYRMSTNPDHQPDTPEAETPTQTPSSQKPRRRHISWLIAAHNALDTVGAEVSRLSSAELLNDEPPPENQPDAPGSSTRADTP